MEHRFSVTTHGQAAIIACTAFKKPPKLCRVAFGAGLAEEGTVLADRHELLEYVSEGAITAVRHQGNRLSLTIQYANSEHPDVPDFPLSEYMVFIQNPETGEETDFLYGTLGDYRQMAPAFRKGSAPCVFDYPLEIILSNDLTVEISAPAGLLTWRDLGVPGGAASLDDGGRIPEVQMPWRHLVAAVRPRDPGKPDYGAGGGGGGAASVALETGPYTGGTEAGVVVNGVLYDAKNMSTHGDTAPDGTILIKTEEQENG